MCNSTKDTLSFSGLSFRRISSVPVSKASRYSSFFIWFFIFVIFRLLMIACLIFIKNCPLFILRENPKGSWEDTAGAVPMVLFLGWQTIGLLFHHIPARAGPCRTWWWVTYIYCVCMGCMSHLLFLSVWLIVSHVLSSTYHVLGVLGHVHLLCNPFLPGQARAGRD